MMNTTHTTVLNEHHKMNTTSTTNPTNECNKYNRPKLTLQDEYYKCHSPNRPNEHHKMNTTNTTNFQDEHQNTTMNTTR